MLVQTNYKGLRKVGDVLDVPDNVASRWYKNKIATLTKKDIAKLFSDNPNIEEGESDGETDSDNERGLGEVSDGGSDGAAE
jgi:hypothetical protein